MKKNFLFLLLIVLLCASCGQNNQKTITAKDETTKAIVSENETTDSETKEEETEPRILVANAKDIVESSGNFDYKNGFRYTGDDKYIKTITEDMLLLAAEHYDAEYKKTVEIPTPYIVKVDDSRKNDIKIYGDFYIYGYNVVDDVVFFNENGGSYPGCYHLKEDEDGNITVLSKEIAEDGSNNYESLLLICENDEDLCKKVFSAKTDLAQYRIDYVKMYAKDNNLKILAIKDYGWPVEIFDDAADSEFLYLFYKNYMNEISQENLLNDMALRLNRLKEKYMTKELIEKLDKIAEEEFYDPIINAQDVTFDMLNSIETYDQGNGSLKVQFDTGSKDLTTINVKIQKNQGKRIITSLE